MYILDRYGFSLAACSRARYGRLVFLFRGSEASKTFCARKVALS